MVGVLWQTLTVLTITTLGKYGIGATSNATSSPTSSIASRSDDGGEKDDSAIMPGTNWCGRGTKAQTYTHLGVYGGADKCCRQHDLGCPFYIRSGQINHGLYNYKMYTLNHCTCDERFRSCLRMVNSARADMVGRFFFDIIRIPCFVFSQAKRCTSWTWWGKCIHEEITRQAVLRPPMSYWS